MNPNVSRVLAIVSQTVTRITHSMIVSDAAPRIAFLVLTSLSYPSVANAQIEWRISVKVFLDEFGQRPCLLEPDDCRYTDCCYDTDEEIRDMFEGMASQIVALNERGITISVIEIRDLHPDNLPPVPCALPIDHYCDDAGDDDGPCDPAAADPCPLGNGVCVERPVDCYCDDAGHNLGPCDPADADPCPGGGTCVADSYHWYHAWVGEGDVTHILRDVYVHEDDRFYYNPNAVNVYMFPTYFGGRCACYPWDGPDPEAIITLGHGKGRVVPMHELGHFMGLCHTQGCECGDCGTPKCDGGINHDNVCMDDADCPGGICDFVCHTEPGDDHLADTLPDLECWEPNDIALNSFDVDYDHATSSQKEQVDNVWYNVISYHEPPPPRLTSDQLDRMMDVSGTTWFAITGRCTFFVDGDPDVPPILTGYMNCSRGGTRPDLDEDEHDFPDTQLDGSSAIPLSTVAGALAEAGDGDIVMIRGGYYDEQLTINQSVFLRANQGNAVIGIAGP